MGLWHHVVLDDVVLYRAVLDDVVLYRAVWYHAVWYGMMGWCDGGVSQRYAYSAVGFAIVSASITTQFGIISMQVPHSMSLCLCFCLHASVRRVRQCVLGGFVCVCVCVCGVVCVCVCVVCNNSVLKSHFHAGCRDMYIHARINSTCTHMTTHMQTIYICVHACIHICIHTYMHATIHT